MLTWSNDWFGGFLFPFSETSRRGCIDSVAFCVGFLLLFNPCGNSVEAVAKSLWKQWWWWILYYHPGSSYFPLVPFQFWKPIMCANRKVFHGYKHFSFFFSLHHVAFPISIISYTNYNIISFTNLHIKPMYITTVLQKKKKRRCTLKVISEDLRQYSNGSAATAA